MQLTDEQKETASEVLETWLRKKLTQPQTAKRLVIDILQAAEKGGSVKTFEERFVKRHVRVAKASDGIWMDKTASDLLAVLLDLYPEEQGNVSAMKLGRALSNAGALKYMRSGISVYRIRKIKLD